MDSCKIQYASDLHLDETMPFDILLEPVASTLALCGDIGNPFSKIYFNFLKWCSEHWKTVILIAGNHEYFSDDSTITMRDIDVKIHEICTKLGIRFLQKGVFRDDEHKLLIVGCTLWTSPDLRQWDKIADGFIGEIGKRSEYKMVYVKDEYTNKSRYIHPSDITKINTEHIAFLEKTIKQARFDNFRVLVLTHHMPCKNLIDSKYRENPLSSCYANNLSYLFKEPIVGWICGHSHVAGSVRYTTGTLCALNPRGYKSEANTSGYTRDAVITIYRENIAVPKRA
jgi:DNA repair exonuclease SbcCD nuclease subunit